MLEHELQLLPPAFVALIFVGLNFWQQGLIYAVIASQLATRQGWYMATIWLVVTSMFSAFNRGARRGK